MYNMLVAIIGFTQQKEKRGKGEKGGKEGERIRSSKSTSLSFADKLLVFTFYFEKIPFNYR